MVTFVPSFVSAAVADWDREARAAAAAVGIDAADYPASAQFLRAYRLRRPAPACSVDDVAAHCEHVREVAGIDHVGLGGDFDGVEQLPSGLEDVSRYPVLLERLAERGWSDADLGRLTSGNAVRVLREVEAVARSVQAERGPGVATPAALDPPVADGPSDPPAPRPGTGPGPVTGGR